MKAVFSPAHNSLQVGIPLRYGKTAPVAFSATLQSSVIKVQNDPPVCSSVEKNLNITIKKRGKTSIEDNVKHSPGMQVNLFFSYLGELSLENLWNIYLIEVMLHYGDSRNCTRIALIFPGVGLDDVQGSPLSLMTL